MPATVTNMKNALTIDVEDYFQVSAFEKAISRSSWDSRERRVDGNMDRILALLSERSTKATFFVLGWIAERHPDLVRAIVDEGHELASHGYGHQRVSDLTPDQFCDDVTRAKAILEDISGREIKGYRAPSYSIGKKNIWALQVLEQTGHQYSSSIYPIHHDHYGFPEAPRFMFREAETGIVEIPITTVRWLNHLRPAGGGGFFRFYPYAISRWAISRVNRKDRQPTVFYFHPWEIDPEQPRVSGISVKTRFRHYLNLEKTKPRLERLLGDFHWGTMEEVFFTGEDIPVHRLGN